MIFFFEFGPVVQGMPFKDISNLELWWSYCLVEQKHLGNFCRGLYEEHCQV